MGIGLRDWTTAGSSFLPLAVWRQSKAGPEELDVNRADGAAKPGFVVRLPFEHAKRETQAGGRD